MTITPLVALLLAGPAHAADDTAGDDDENPQLNAAQLGQDVLLNVRLPSENFVEEHTWDIWREDEGGDLLQVLDAAQWTLADSDSIDPPFYVFSVRDVCVDPGAYVYTLHMDNGDWSVTSASVTAELSAEGSVDPDCTVSTGKGCGCNAVTPATGLFGVLASFLMGSARRRPTSSLLERARFGHHPHHDTASHARKGHGDRPVVGSIEA